MFHPWRVLSFAALAAMVSVSAQAANYRFVWWKMAGLTTAQMTDGKSVPARTAVLSGESVDLLAGQGLCGKVDGTFSESNGYTLYSNKTLTNGSSDGNGRALAFAEKRFECLTEGVLGTRGSPTSNSSALYIAVKDLVNGQVFVLVSAYQGSDPSTKAGNYKTFIGELATTYPGAIILFGTDAGGKDKNGIPFAPKVEAVLSAAGLYKIFDNAEDDVQSVYCSDENVAKSAEVSSLSEGETYGAPCYMIDLKVSVKRTVTFLDMDGELIAERTCEFGESVTPPDAPEVEGMEFVGWTPESDFGVVTENFSVTAAYKASGNAHAVYFRDGDAPFFSTTVPDGETVAPPSPDPEKEGHTFSGWLLNGTPYDFNAPVKEDLALDSSFAINRFKVTFKDWDGNPIEEEPQSVEYKGAAVAPVLPTLPENRLFEGWDGDFSCVTQDIDVVARIVVDQQEVTTDNFKAVITDGSSALTTYVLTGDVALEEWSPVDFKGTLDGAGHEITGLKTSLFVTLTGSVSNLFVNGLVDEEPTVLKAVSVTNSGVIASMVVGGKIANCAVDGFKLQEGLYGRGSGIIAGTISNGAEIRNCRTGEHCSFDVKEGAFVGGIVGNMTSTDDYTGSVGGLVYGCTNFAAMVKTRGDNNTSGGCGGIVGQILAPSTSADASLWTVEKCENDGRLSTRSIGVRFGGIVGRAQSATEKCVMKIVNCRNCADIDVSEAGDSDKNKGPVVGGLVANAASSFFGTLEISGSANLGSLSVGYDSTVSDDVPRTFRVAGGLLGDSGLAKNGKFVIVDTANYGTVSGKWAGGLFGVLASNKNYGGTTVVCTNVANYGVVEGGIVVITNGVEVALGGAGTLCARNVSASTTSVRRELVNGFFVGNDLCMETDAGLSFVETNVYRPAAKDAKTLLDAYATENGLMRWINGRIDGVVYPELEDFCQKPYIAGFMLFIR